MVFMKIDPEKVIVESVCNKIVTLREEKAISQQRLAEIADISRTGLRHIESGETSPTLFTLLKICKALNVELSAILSDLDR